MEPLLIAQWDEEVTIRMSLRNPLHGWVGKMIVVVVRNDNSINNGNVTDLARYLCIPFRTQP